MKSKILFLTMFLIATFTFSQTANVTGTVTDNSTIPLPGVNVIIIVPGFYSGSVYWNTDCLCLLPSQSCYCSGVKMYQLSMLKRFTFVHFFDF